jgi:hypothetical protein
MKPENPVHYDPGLIEEVVFLAVSRRPEAKRFHRERSPIYGITDAEEREQAFQNFHRAWFFRLGLSEQVEKTLAEQPLLSANVKSCLVARAPGREEGAELFVNPDQRLNEKERRTISIFLRPESFLSPLALQALLRHELLHIADMLDPSFGYEPVLPAAGAGPTHDRLQKERYRVLWDATIDGRMARRGWAPGSLRAERLSEFRRAFPMLREESGDLFSRFFDREAHTHAELVAFVLDPKSFDGALRSPQPGGRCPLCGFPTYVFEHKPEELPAEALARITQDFPQWHPSDGLCTQCADLYRACQDSIITSA